MHALESRLNSPLTLRFLLLLPRNSKGQKRALRVANGHAEVHAEAATVVSRGLHSKSFPTIPGNYLIDSNKPTSLKMKRLSKTMPKL